MDISMIVALVVLGLLAISYLIMFTLMFTQSKKMIRGRLFDAQIEREVVDEYLKFRKKKLALRSEKRIDFKENLVNSLQNDDYIDLKSEVEVNEFTTHVEKRRKRGKALDVLASIITLFIAFLSLVCLSAAILIRNKGDSFFIGGNAFLVVETGSMEEKNPLNTYLEENALENQIRAGSFITIKRDCELKLYNIYAFKSLEDSKIIVHRLIKIIDTDGELSYTFRGDSNSNSLKSEIMIPKERIIGQYTGYQNYPLGQIVLYLQSGIGIIAVTLGLLVLIGFTIFDDMENKRIMDRKRAFLPKAYKLYKKWQYVNWLKDKQNLTSGIQLLECGDQIVLLKEVAGYKVLSSGSVVSQDDKVTKILMEESEEILTIKNKALSVTLALEKKRA